MVDAAHEGVAADRANRPSPAVPIEQRRHLDEPRPVQQQFPGRLVQRTPLRQVARRTPPTRWRRPRARRRRRAARRARERAPALVEERNKGVQGKAVDDPAQDDAADRARGQAGQVLGRLGNGDRVPALEGVQGDRATRLHPACHRAAAGERVEEDALAAVRVHDIASGTARQHVRRDRTGPRAQFAGRGEPGGAVDRPVLVGQPCLERRDAGGEETEGLDHMAHGLVQLAGRAVNRPLPTAAPPAQAPGRSRAGAALGLECVRQLRRAGVVRAVAVAEMRERCQEVPRVAPLGCQPSEGRPQRLGRTRLVRTGRTAGGVVVLTPPRRVRGTAVGGKGCGHGARCYRRCALLVRRRQFGPGPERLPSGS